MKNEKMPVKKVPHDDLETLIRGTARDARIMTGRCKEDNRTFTKGMRHYTAGMVSRKTLLGYLRKYKKTHYSRIPGTENCVLLHPRLFVSLDSVRLCVDIPTRPEKTAGFVHLASETHPAFGIFYQFDRDARTLTFRLGDAEKTLRLKEGSRHDWKAEVNVMRCQSLEDLEAFMQAPLLANTFVTLGRRILHRVTTDKEKREAKKNVRTNSGTHRAAAERAA